MVGLGGVWFRVAECEAAVVEALQEQDNVCERVVDGKDYLSKSVSGRLILQLKKPYHSRHDALKNSSCHVEKVARCD